MFACGRESGIAVGELRGNGAGAGARGAAGGARGGRAGGGARARLDAAVDGDDAHALALHVEHRRRVGDEELRLLERHLRDEVELVRVDLRHVGVGAARRKDLAEHRAALADVLGERARVDAVDRGDARLLEPRAERLVEVPVRRIRRVLGHNQGGDVDVRRLEVEREPEVVLLVGGHAVVADEREREHEQLPAVRRVGERLRIPDHRRVEDDLARDAAVGAERRALPPRAVVEHELGLRLPDRLQRAALRRLAARQLARIRRRAAQLRHVLETALAPELVAVEDRRLQFGIDHGGLHRHRVGRLHERNSGRLDRWRRETTVGIVARAAKSRSTAGGRIVRGVMAVHTRAAPRDVFVLTTYLLSLRVLLLLRLAVDGRTSVRVRLVHHRPPPARGPRR